MYRAVVCGDLDAVGWLTSLWFATGTSSITEFVRYVEARLNLISRYTAQVQSLASQAETQALPRIPEDASPRLRGTIIHNELEDIIRALDDPLLDAEVVYRNGKVLQVRGGPGTAGAVRLDVVLGPLDEPIAIFDLKTGAEGLTSARIAEIRLHLPLGFQDIPIIEIGL